ncbi:MAG: EpsI family protein [Chthoniobacterales bacterium]|nr:EpsI family protein [Chthoniobacterales bacterium]
MITKRLLTVTIVLVVGFSTVFLLPKSTKSSPAGIAMVLPNYVGDWIGQDAEVTQREREVLAKDTEFARKTYTNLAGDSIFVSIVLSGDDMTNSIHRPERCLPAQGWNLQASSSRALPLDEGRQLELTRLRTARSVQRKDDTQATLRNITYYCFIGHEDVTASHLERTTIDLRDRILRGQNQRWAYVTVAAIVTEGWVHPSRTEEETAAVMEEFMRLLVPELKRPDGAALL